MRTHTLNLQALLEKSRFGQSYRDLCCEFEEMRGEVEEVSERYTRVLQENRRLKERISELEGK